VRLEPDAVGRTPWRFGEGRRATSSWWREDIHLETAVAVATYRGGLLDGQAAVLENAYGAGKVVYVATLLDDETFSSVLLGAVESAGVENAFDGVPAHIECAVRRNDTTEFVFLLNHSGDVATTVSVAGRDLLTDAAVTDNITLAPLQAAVIQRNIRMVPPSRRQYR